MLAPLRDECFPSLAAVNAALAAGCERVNARPFQKLPGSRRSVFETLERAALRPLPPTRYELAEWRRAKANIDYHVAVEQHFYSVPYALVGAQVDVRLTATTVEILAGGKRVAAHARSRVPGRYTTNPGHRPKSHQQHLEWTPSRLIRWGAAVGPATGQVVEHILARLPHPEQGYRACLGLLALRRRYGDTRLDAAAARALALGAVSYRSIKSMLTSGLDRLPLAEPTAPLRLPATHAHLRGADYYRDPAAEDA